MIATTKLAKKKKKVPSAQTATQAEPNEANAALPQSGLRIRMYRQGLGDCFLITLQRQGSAPFQIVIDCGVVLGTKDPTTIMSEVVQNITDETGGNIDLLVITHEHWDHVSGFNQAKDLIKDWKVARVWTAWTEDPKDPLANKLRKERKETEDALRLSFAHLAAAGAGEQAGRLESLLSFLGATAGSTSAALDYAKSLAAGGPRFCQPGEPPIELSKLPGYRFWILGPPKAEKLIRKSNPGKDEAYGLDDGLSGSNALFVKALSRGIGAAASRDVFAASDSVDEPFEARFTIPLSCGKAMPFFDHHYFGESTDQSLHNRSGQKALRDQSWRRIDADWLDSSETLALQLDSATNNTSLVLAIETVATGDILLFPGDAQAGNWLSWQDLKWTLGNGSTGVEVSGPDLLARTIFYKVGHHGSHNATLREKGLELMTHENLVAMIPVDHAMAVIKRWGKMPLPDLVERLKEKTNGRVLRIDDSVTTAADLDGLRPDGVSQASWTAFTSKVRVDRLYYDFSP